MSAPLPLRFAFSSVAPLALAALAVAQPGRTAPALFAGFVENAGQWPQEVLFAARGGGLDVAVECAALCVRGAADGEQLVRLRFVGASHATASGAGRDLGAYHFYAGAEAYAWREHVCAHERVRLAGLYDGVDLVVRHADARVEYDLEFAPGAELAQVLVECAGVDMLELDASGELLLHTPSGCLRQSAPRAWQVDAAGARRDVQASFRIAGENHYAFDVPERDPALALVIDPGLEWSTFLGGSGADYIGPAVLARDGSGDVFVGGTMRSLDFPFLADPTFSPYFQDRAFVARLSSDGSEVRYATFLGGWHSQLVRRGLDVDAAGNAVLAGQTFSPDFPTTNGAFDRVGVNKDAFVVRLNAQGTLLFSTFLGGDGEDEAVAVAYDPAGEIVVGGNTSSANFPVTAGAFDTAYNAPNSPQQGGAHGDMWIARLAPQGTSLTYGTYLGGPQVDYMEDLAVDPAGFVTVAGWVTGNDAQVFVTTPGAFDRTWNGNQDGALARLKLDGAGASDLRYATLIGGSFGDNLWSIAFDPANPEFVTVAGRSWSNDYPTTAGVVRPTNPPFSALFPEVEAGIVSRFRFPAAGGGSLVWSTYHHGQYLTDVTVTAAGEAIVTGSAPWDLPTTRGAFDRIARGSGASGDQFVGRLNANATQYACQGFFGGRGPDGDNFRTTPQLVLAQGNTVIVSGQTSSPDFPTTPGVFDAAPNGSEHFWLDGFVSRLALDAETSGDLDVSAPALVSPANGAVYHNGLLGRLEWSAVQDAAGIAGYEYQLSSRADFDPRFLLHRGGVSAIEALVPPSYGVSGGLPQIPLFWRVRAEDRAGNLSAWSATRSFTISATSGLAVVSSIGVHPASSHISGVVGGANATGAISLYDPAPTGGLVVRLEALNNRSQGLDQQSLAPVPLSVPANVFVPAGAFGATFPITTSVVSSIQTVSLVATANGVGAPTFVTVLPPLAAAPTTLRFAPRTLAGGRTTTATLALDAAAPSGGTLVRIESSHPGHATLPASVLVPAGERSVSFPVVTHATATDVDVNVRATTGADATGTSLLVKRANLPPLTAFTLAANSVSAGTEVNGTVTFAAPLPTGIWPATDGALLTIDSSDAESAGVAPLDEFVSPGTTAHPFRLYTRGRPTPQNVTLTLRYDAQTFTRTLTVGAVAGVNVASVTSNVTNVPGSFGGVATVNLTAPAPAPISLDIQTSHPAAFRGLPEHTTIFAGSTSSSFAFVASNALTTTTPVTITVSFGASSRSLTLTILPPNASNPPLVSLALAPNPVSGGSAVAGTLTLAGPAPAGGVDVQLFSSQPTVANVPASVHVAAGATSASFVATTSSVQLQARVRVEALYLLNSSLELVVTPGGAQPLAAPVLVSPAHDATIAQPVALDWNNVTGASSYEVQIDDASDFAAPLAAAQIVTASQWTATNLARRRFWWRARALDTNGVAGSWSLVRSFVALAAPQVTLTSFTVSPSTVSGGASATGTVSLSGPAPSAGLVIALSANSAAASTPANLTVPAGATSATFSVTTTSVASTTAVTLSAVLGPNTRTTTLTVNATGGGAPAAPSLVSPAHDARFQQGQTITFDWNDVANAASYQIQIDDQDSFAAPQLVAQTTTASSFATSTLPRRTMWWRVRAVNAAGVAGAWSSVRRVRVE